MAPSHLKLTFYDDNDGTGELTAEACADGYTGTGSAYFGIDELKHFAKAIAEFPLPERTRCQIAGGFYSKEVRGKLEHEHLGIDVYPVDHRGHIGIQVRAATQLWQDMRPDSQKTAKVEIITSYEPLAKFSRQLLALIAGKIREATLEGETLS
jgi:hypothetical protein